jgi:hypothetical protein
MTPQAARTRKPFALSLLTNPDERMLTLQEAADRSSMNINRIKLAVDEGELTIYEFGLHSKRVLLSDLQRWWKRFTA